MNEQDFVQLTKDCVGLCGVLETGLRGRDVDSLSAPVREAINDLKE